MSEPKLIARTHGDATLTVPLGWVDLSIATYVGPPNSGGQHPTVVVAIRSHPGKLQLEALAQRQLAELQEALRDFMLLGHGIAQVPNGPSRYRLSYAFTQMFGDEAVRLQQDQWYCVRDHKLLTVTTTVAEADYPNYGAALEQIATSSDFAAT